MVEDVERLYSQFKLALLADDRNRSGKRCVEVQPSRTVQYACSTAGVANGPDGGHCERRGIEGQFAIGQPRTRGDIRVRVADNIDAGSLIGRSRNILGVGGAETR